MFRTSKGLFQLDSIYETRTKGNKKRPRAASAFVESYFIYSLELGLNAAPQMSSLRPLLMLYS